MAVVDELAAAGELVKGKSDQVPVAVVRGIAGRTDGSDGAGASVLVRSADEDLFSLGTAEARTLGLHDAATLTDAKTFTPGRSSSAGRRSRGCRTAPSTCPSTSAPRWPSSPRPAIRSRIAQTGAEIHRLRARLAADGYATAWLDVDASRPPRRPARSPLGVLAIGRP